MRGRALARALEWHELGTLEGARAVNIESRGDI